MSSDRFKGKACVVTGAASGMGRATALQLAEEGGDVLAVDINQAGLLALEADAGELPGNIQTQAADLTDPEAAPEVVARAVNSFGRLDVVANVAGVGGITPLGDLTFEHWRQTMAINVDSIFLMCQAAMPHLLESRGNIVNVASTAGMKGQAYMLAYVASKHAVVGLTKTLAVEFARRGVRINAVCPGSTDTPLLKQFMPPKGVDFDLLMRSGLIEDRCDPEDIARMICFTASHDARFINGALQTVDGGSTAG